MDFFEFQKLYEDHRQGLLNPEQERVFLTAIGRDRVLREEYENLLGTEQLLSCVTCKEPPADLGDRVLSRLFAEAEESNVVSLFGVAPPVAALAMEMSEEDEEALNGPELERVEALLDLWTAPEPPQDLAARTYRLALRETSPWAAMSASVVAFLRRLFVPERPQWVLAPLATLAVAGFFLVHGPLSPPRVEQTLAMDLSSDDVLRLIASNEVRATTLPELALMVRELEESRAATGLDGAEYHLLAEAIADIAGSPDFSPNTAPARIEREFRLDL